MQPGDLTFVDGECAVKRIDEDENNWLYKSDNSKYDTRKVPKSSSDGYPIIGEVIYNLTKSCKVR